MSRNVIVGAFVLLGIAALFAIVLVLQNVGPQGRYKIGVQFKTASGIHRGALVYESGVNVGIVDDVQLQPDDFTVEVVLAINNTVDIPRDAEFLIQAPLTGDATLEIVPKPQDIVGDGSGVITARPPAAAVAVLPREVLPRPEQPHGTNPATLSDLLQEGQGQVHQLGSLLADLQKREPKLLDTFQSALSNANDIAITTNAQTQKLAKRLDALENTLSLAIDTGSSNIVDITRRMDNVVAQNGGKIGTLLDQFNLAAHTLNDTADQIHDLAKNPQLRQNLLDTTRGIAETAQTFAGIAGDLRKVTSNVQTQAQLRDTIANFDAASQKANSLLGEIGGRSAVYGVDQGATPAPSPGIPANGTLPAPNGASNPANIPNVLKSKLATIAHNLVALQIQVGELDQKAEGSDSSPLLTRDRGPQTDVNAILLPNGGTSLLVGANDIGSFDTTTWNVAGLENLGHGFHLGGGVLYSRLGELASYNPGGSAFGLEERLYDPRHPTLDGYATLRLAKGLNLFGGERDVTHTGRRTDFGLRLNF